MKIAIQGVVTFGCKNNIALVAVHCSIEVNRHVEWLIEVEKWTNKQNCFQS